MSSGYNSNQRPASASSEFNAVSFLVRALLSGTATAKLVKVMGVTNDGSLEPSGTVDIQPLVNQVDGIGQAVPHGTIYKCPYMRMQGGANAIILDPVVGDLGVAVFADRDSSSAIANKGQANPGSSRQFDMADGLYLGGLLNGVPSQFVQFFAAGIQITSPTAIKLDAPSITLTAPSISLIASAGILLDTPTVTATGDIDASGTVSATEVDAPTVNVSTTLTVAGKNLGPTHTHDHGTMTASGHTGTVI